MAVNFDALFAALGGQESGGNYGATNGRTGASGKYQIMPANIGPWSKQYLGRTVSQQEYRSSPQIQEQLARAVFQDYYNKYGDRGALSAWYSGQPGKANNYTKFRSNEPSVGEYVDSVLKRAGGAGGSAATATSIPGTFTDNTAKESDIASMFPGGGGDPYSMMSAAIGAGNTAPGIEQGTQAPGFDAVSGAAQRAAAQKATAAAVQVIPTVDEGTFNAAHGLGSGDTTGKAAAIINLGKQYLGTMYKWGGAAPGGFDCSGLLYYIFKQNGITLPRVSYQQANVGKHIAWTSAKAGDLIAWDNSSRNNGADHIALYLGNGLILEAPKAGVPVRIRALTKNDSKAWAVQMNL